MNLDFEVTSFHYDNVFYTSTEYGAGSYIGVYWDETINGEDTWYVSEIPMNVDGTPSLEDRHDLSLCELSPLELEDVVNDLKYYLEHCVPLLEWDDDCLSSFEAFIVFWSDQAHELFEYESAVDEARRLGGLALRAINSDDCRKACEEWQKTFDASSQIVKDAYYQIYEIECPRERK